MLAMEGVRNFRVNCGYSIRGDLHCGHRMAEPISGSLASHSTINSLAFSKSSPVTSTFALACGFDMKTACWRCPSLWTSAFTPASCRRALRCFALAGSVNVAIVTIIFAASRPPIKHQLLAERKIRRWEPFVDHQVDEHAGDGNIKPDRHRPARDPPMAVPAPPKNGNEREDDERQCDEREHDVRNEHGKIERPDNSLRGELRGAFANMR